MQSRGGVRRRGLDWPWLWGFRALSANEAIAASSRGSVTTQGPFPYGRGSETRNPKPGNPKPETRKPETRNPETRSRKLPIFGFPITVFMAQLHPTGGLTLDRMFQVLAYQAIID